MQNDSDLNILNQRHTNSLKPGMVDLTPLYGLIKISGNDAGKFLQGQLTCNVDLMTTQAKLAAHCNPQGRIISLFYIFNLANEYYLLLPIDMVTIAINALKKYAVFFKTAIEDVTSQYNIIGQHGSTPQTLSQQSIAHVSLSPTRYIFISKIIPPANAIQIFEWKAQDLLEKIPSVYAATSNTFLPHELDLPSLGAIDFEKGCYTGQEIIARMHYRGKVKVKLFCCEITSEQPPALGEDVYSQTDAISGSVVETCFIDENNYLVLITANENKTDMLFLNNDTNKRLTILT